MRYVDKQFLSHCYGESGSIVVELSSPLKEDMSKHRWMNEIDCSISISDCSRTIHLDFSFSDQEGLEKRIKKIDKMIEVLNNLKPQLPVALIEYEKNLEEVKKENEEKEKQDE